MADSKAPGKGQAKDPTIRTLKGAAPEYPEGTHPINDLKDQDWGPHRFDYEDVPDDEKPDPSTVAQRVERNHPSDPDS